MTSVVSRDAVGDGWRIPNGLWEHIEPLLPRKRCIPKGDGPGPLPASAWMASSMSYAPAAIGKPFPGPLELPAQCISGFSSVGQPGCLDGCGNRDFWSMTPGGGWSGNGKRWMGP